MVTSRVHDEQEAAETTSAVRAMIAPEPGGELASQETFERAGAMASSSGSKLLEAEVLLGHSYALALRMRPTESLEKTERARGLLDATPRAAPARLTVLAHTHSGIALGLLARFEESRRAHAKALSVAEGAGLEMPTFRSWINSGYANVQLGDTAAAMHAYHSALANCGPGNPLFGFGRIMLGELFLDFGNLEAAEAQINEAILRLAAETVYLGNHRISLALARIWGRTGRRDEARTLFETVRSDLVDTETIGHVLTWLAMADVALHELDVEEVGRCCDEVATIASATWFPDAARVMLIEALLGRGEHAAVDAHSSQLDPDRLPFLLRRRLLAARRKLSIDRRDWEAAYHYLDQERPQPHPSTGSRHSSSTENVNYPFSEELNNVVDLSAQHLELRCTVESTQAAAHDLRTPFQSSVLLIDLLREQAGAQFSESFDLLAKQVERANSIVNRMTSLATSELLSPTAGGPGYDLGRAVANAIDRTRPILEAKRQTIVFRDDSTDPRTPLAKDLLQRVVDNLVSNASKYSLPGTEVVVNLSNRAPGEVDLAVIDHGLGFTADDIERAFGYQQTLSAQPTGGERASGLGLFITRQILQTAGGTVSIQSGGKDQGSTVTAHLPAADPPSTPD